LIIQEQKAAKKMNLEKLKKKFPNSVLRTQHPYYMADAIGDIPDCLAACLAAENLTRIKQSLGDFRPERIFALGCGTSYNACQAAAYTLQDQLHIPAAAYDAFDFELNMPPGVDARAMVIAVSESGQSITTCLSLEKARELGAFTVGISANPDSRLARSANLSLVDPFLHEIPLGKTRTYLSTALLAMLAGISTRESAFVDRFVSQVNSTIAALRENSAYWQSAARGIASQLSFNRASYIVTGFGAQKANCDEIRLKLMEVLGESATSFGLEEFTHGPSASFHSNMMVIMLQTDLRTLEKAVRIAQGVVFSSARLVVITDHPYADWPETANIINIPEVENSALFGQFPATVAAQYLFYFMALHKDLNPDVNLEDIHPELGDIYAFFFPPGTH
jgi:glutamine---fructose-6-phosphate transaminase (isomerizing)